MIREFKLDNNVFMALTKKMKDHLLKMFFGKTYVPSGLYEMEHYFRIYEPIRFKYEKKDDTIVAISTNFKYGSIITSGKDEKEVDNNIKDAILTSFAVPSSYSKAANIHKVELEEYALA